MTKYDVPIVMIVLKKQVETEFKMAEKETDLDIMDVTFSSKRTKDAEKLQPGVISLDT